MNSSDQALETIARSLREAYSGETIAPVRVELKSQEQAYQVQEINTQYWLDQKRSLVGCKIGLTAPAVQKQLGVDEPDFGMLFADMVVEDGAVFPLSQLIQPKLEAELAFVMACDLNKSDVTADDVINSTAYLVPALEIVDSRITDWDINICDTVADNASSARFVLGSKKIDPRSVDLPTVAMHLYCDDVLGSQGYGADCLGSPVNAVVWLARKMHELRRPLKAGDVVLSGALGSMVNIEGKGRYRADVDGFGSVGIEFK